MEIILTSEQRERVVSVLLQAFDPNHLQAMLTLKTGIRLYEEMSVLRGLKPIVIDLVTLAEGDGWLDKLLLSANEYRQGQNLKLKALVEELHLKPPPKEAKETVPVLDQSDTDRLEKIVRKRAPLLPFAEFAAKLAAIGNQMCRIEYPAGEPQGTGWLVAPNLVLTAYHVIEDVHKEENGLEPADITCRFDYDGIQRPTGNRTCKLANDWLLASSPYSQADLKATSAVPKENELDFALLQLNERVGEDTMSGEQQRGWIQVSEKAPVLMKDDFVVIPQHPQGRTLELAFGEVLQYNKPANRVQYDATTDHGSSGASCFDIFLVPFALHHAAGPSDSLEYNQAVPLKQIIKYLKEQQTPIPAFWTK
ncbi:trypsin-like peptidase domain-containing protein [Niastella sp. OAS944]|uniref:trypsin-like peptidase domain-containing protein n=1 Tax=Niastella sp. OAS944 TaxID=2664089 RepID=UPI0034935FA7|nr:V8-like Glu-specific endopeptidase [Chitinophagaceae bacterium OAS944]